jgi:predicted secreted protein
MAANRQVARLGIEVEWPVDIFGVIEDTQIWLRFGELENLFGFFQRAEDVAGISVHSGHPLSLQRFTAAHEYGHYVLGHVFSQDGDTELYGSGDLPAQEIQAQAFAAEFLMPLALVNRALGRLSLPEAPAEIGAAQAYQLSLEIGASYQATVARLNQLNKVSYERAAMLREHAPIDLKVELGSGQRPGNSRAAVWAVDEGLRHRNLSMWVEDELHVRLGEVPSSGFRWAVSAGSAEGLELVADELERGGSEAQIGGSLCRHLWWRAVEPGAGALDLRLVREWQDAEAEPADTVNLPITIGIPRNASETGTGIALPQREALLAGV